MTPLRIRPDSGVSLYRQVAGQLRDKIAAGELPAGAPLPSVRALSAELGINPLTIGKAYVELERQGLVATRWGKGTFVADGRQLAPGDLQRLVNEKIDAFLAEVSPLMNDSLALPALVKARLERRPRKA